MSEQQELVTVTIDGEQIQVPKGTNIIEAAKQAGIEIPHYCYHPGLSVAGNCRMCQVQVEGMPKLAIGCNLTATDGLIVRTHHTSEEVEEAQAATLEFLLINHPLDCTVCDQAGHCKLQDYHYEYNTKASRFIEEKVKSVKAEPLGPDIVYDGERCIVCTRCVRFCDEISKTSELGVFNRGDKAVISIQGKHELDNPLAGSVVDLCPVGALTHKRWRFNTRIWYTDEKDSICTGCSTGCNVKVAVRDDQVVQVKARYNKEVNEEWLCDEGRYGFERFQPATRLTEPMTRNGESFAEKSWDEALEKTKLLSEEGDAAVFISPMLTLEEMWVASRFATEVMKVSTEDIAIQLVQRELNEVEKVLVSPDYAPNARGASLVGLLSSGGDWRDELEKKYKILQAKVRSGSVKRILLVGDYAIRDEDIDTKLASGLQQAEISVALTPRGVDGELGAASGCKVILPGRTVNEKSGVMVNGSARLQRLAMLLNAPLGSFSEWMLLNKIAIASGKKLIPEDIIDDRSLFRHMAKSVDSFSDLSLVKIGEQGASL